MPYLIAYDLGTGGIKASLHNDLGAAVGKTFFEYPTYYPRNGWYEQRPEDWWRGVCASTGRLLSETGISAFDVCTVALSGHSLVAAPLDHNGKLLLDQVPIWSDSRAAAEAEEYFTRIPYENWYMTTGNGDPPETYSVMKLIWLKKHYPDIWEKTTKVTGSKDYINFKLTGNVRTDFSYASGSGLFDLTRLKYHDDYLAAADIGKSILPEVVDSHTIIGTVTRQAAEECGLAEGTSVACGGVDNACMALGACGIGEGRTYMSLGSSSWIAVTSTIPILDIETRPYIFAHIEKGYYTSGVSIFAAGSAHRWARDVLYREMDKEHGYELMDELAAYVPAGANGVLFNPTLSGGSTQNISTQLRGGFAGITLSTTRDELLRAILEGVALDLDCFCLKTLKNRVAMKDEILMCGGGAKSTLWRQIFADVFGINILKTNIDQDAASLGAAAIAARAAGLWKDYSPVDKLYCTEQLHKPDTENHRRYTEISEVYKVWTEGLAKLRMP